MDKNFVYKPMEYSEYLEKYVNSLKTGELIVDPDNHDIFISEEGLNIPLPKTKELREKIIDFLSNNVEGIKLKNELLGRKLKYSEKLKENIEDLQHQAYLKLNASALQVHHNTSKAIFLEKFSRWNIHQLGTLKLEMDDLIEHVPYYAERLQNLVEKFNVYSSYANDQEYVQTKNDELFYLWEEIKDLFDEANDRVSKLLDIKGSISILKVKTTEIDVWDLGFGLARFNLKNSNEYSYLREADELTNKWNQAKMISLVTDTYVKDLRTGLLLDLNKMKDPEIRYVDWGRPIWKGYSKFDNDRTPLNYYSSLDERWNVTGNRTPSFGKIPRNKSGFGDRYASLDLEYYRNNACIIDGNGVFIPKAIEAHRNPNEDIENNLMSLSVSTPCNYNGSYYNMDPIFSPWGNSQFTHQRMVRLWYCGKGTITTLKTRKVPIPFIKENY